MFRLVWKRIFLGENMILPSCKIQYTKTNRKIAKWKKSKKPDFSKNLPWVFARLVRIKNPPTPSIDLKRKQEEKNCFQRFILILIWKTLGPWHLVNLKKFSPRPPSLYISLYFFVPPSSSIHTHYFPPICFFVKIQHTRKIILPILSETFFHLKNLLFAKRAKNSKKSLMPNLPSSWSAVWNYYEKTKTNLKF